MATGKQTVRVKLKRKAEKQVDHESDAVFDAFYDMVEKIQGMTLEEVMRDKGLDFEKARGREAEKLWTCRITKSWRAVCLLKTGPIIEILMIWDPDEAHSVRRRQ
jgi:hypothetical protein